MAPNKLQMPGSGNGTFVSARPVSASELIEVGAIYGPDGKLVTKDLNAQESFGYIPNTPFVPQLPPGTAPRVTQYPVSFNLMTTPRQEDGKNLSVAALRTLVNCCPYVRVAIEIRKKKFRSRTLSFVYRDDGGSKSKPKTPAYLAAVKKARDFFAYPNRIDQLRFSGFLGQALEEVFVSDGLVFYPWRTQGGDLFALRQINPDTIKVLIDELGTVIGYQQFLYGRAATQYGATTDFERDELMYLTYNPRVDTLYGNSPVEEIVPIVQLAIRRIVNQLSWYTEGNTPTAYLEAPEGLTTPTQLAVLQQYFDENFAGDETERHRIRVLPRGSAIKDVKPFQFTKDEEEAMLTIIVAHLGVPRSTFIAQVNRATAETAAQDAEDSGQKPLEIWFKEWIDDVIQNPEYLDLPDLECKWVGENEGSVVDTANARAIYVNAGIVTVDETRDEMGLDPLEAKDVSAKPAGSVPNPAVDGGVPGAGGSDSGAGAAGSQPGATGGNPAAAAKGAGIASGGAEKRPAAEAEGKPALAPSAAPEGRRSAEAEEVSTWRRFALKPERVKRGRWADPFIPTVLDGETSRSIAERLAGAKTAADARAVFDAVTADLSRRAQPNHPAEPIEKEFTPAVRSRGEAIGKKLAEILAGAKTADQVRHAIRENRDTLVDDGLVSVLAGAILKARARGIQEGTKE